MIGKYIVKSLNETLQLAQEIAIKVKVGTVIALIGNLGTGKTTFTQGFAFSIGITESVGSPTFKLISEFEGDNYWLYHIDCYRLKNAQQFINIGGEEYLENPNGITIIEWADIIEEILPNSTIYIQFQRLPGINNYREITVSKIR